MRLRMTEDIFCHLSRVNWSNLRVIFIVLCSFLGLGDSKSFIVCKRLECKNKCKWSSLKLTMLKTCKNFRIMKKNIKKMQIICLLVAWICVLHFLGPGFVCCTFQLSNCLSLHVRNLLNVSRISWTLQSVNISMFKDLVVSDRKKYVDINWYQVIILDHKLSISSTNPMFHKKIQLLIIGHQPQTMHCYTGNPSKLPYICCLFDSSICGYNLWVFPKIGIPRNGWFIMETPIKMDDLGGPTPIFGNTHNLMSPEWSTVDRQFSFRSTPRCPTGA